MGNPGHEVNWATLLHWAITWLVWLLPCKHPKPDLYLPTLPCTATAFLCFSDQLCQIQLWHFIAAKGCSVARTQSLGIPPEGTAHVCNPALGPALLMRPSRDLVASPKVPGASSIMMSHAYTGEVKVFISIFGETPADCSRLVPSSPWPDLRWRTVHDDGHRTVPLHKKAGDSVELETLGTSGCTGPSQESLVWDDT